MQICRYHRHTCPSVIAIGLQEKNVAAGRFPERHVYAVPWAWESVANGTVPNHREDSVPDSLRECVCLYIPQRRACRSMQVYQLLVKTSLPSTISTKLNVESGPKRHCPVFGDLFISVGETRTTLSISGGRAIMQSHATTVQYHALGSASLMPELSC